MNAIRIAVEPARDLAWYATIPIAYDVTEVLDARVIDGGLGGIALTPRAPSRPRVKDYDAIPGNAPIDWPDHFDLEHWIFLAARVGEEIVGAAAIALETPGVDMLEGRDDLAVLWDLRVLLARRGQGIGAALFRAAETGHRRHGHGKGPRGAQSLAVLPRPPAGNLWSADGDLSGQGGLLSPRRSQNQRAVWSAFVLGKGRARAPTVRITPMALKRLHLLACLVLVPFEALAGVSHATCRVYTEHDNDIPPEVRSLFEQRPGTIAEACALFGDWENARFQVVLPPIRGDLGACQLVFRPIFNENGTWTYESPSGQPFGSGASIFMMAYTGECPPHNDPRYILTNEVTEGTFIAATRFWEQISSGENRGMLRGVSPAEIISTEKFQKFEDDLKYNLQVPASLKLLSVSRVPSDPVKEMAHYELLIDGHRGAWAIVVDFDGGRLRLLNVHSVLF
jgi:GNAT superfamily N-acetyltransferase